MDKQIQNSLPDTRIEPRLITFEGGEGSGKSTVIEQLQKDGEFSGFVFTREPGGTSIGEKIRQIVKDHQLHPTVWTELFLFMAARTQLVEEVINPQLRQGRVVLTDRYFLSTYAYQWFAQIGEHWPTPFMDMVTHAGIPFPGLVIWFDQDPAIGIQRRRGTDVNDRFDVKELEFHRRLRDGFTYLFTEFPMWQQIVHRVDASQPKEVVYQQVTAIIRQYLSSLNR